MIEPDLPHPDPPEGGEDPTHTSDGSGAGSPPAAGARTWGGFQLIESLGHGGFGRVYRAWESSLAREVALKIIRVPDPAQATTVLHEGRLLARVRHPNIVTVHGAQQVGDEIGIWMELIRGRSLAELVRQQGPMSADEAAVVGVHLCQAVAAVHGAGLLHRDIKAQNVMRESGGRIVLMDFGAGREAADPDHSGRGELPGTPRYMAPELFAGQAASRASDIYSLGVLLFFLVTREFPVDGRNVMDFALAHGARRRLSLADVRPDLPAAFLRVVERALSPVPPDRYQSAGAMLQALNDAIPVASQRWPAPAADSPGEAAEDAARTTRLLEPARRLSPTALAARLVVGLVAALLAVGFFGYVTTHQYNDWLDIGTDFATSTPLQWGITGLRSLIPLVVYAALTIVAVRIVVAVWHVIERLLPAVVRLKLRGRDTFTGVLRRLGGPEAQSAGHELLLLQTLVIAGGIWLFYDVYWLLIATDVNTVDAATLDRLRPERATRIWFRPVMTAALVGMVFAWLAVWRRHRARGRSLDRPTLAAGISMMALQLIMLELPYALLFRPADRLVFDQLRCYEVGANATDLLLYCPDAPPPRMRVVPSSDPGVQRTGDSESILSIGR
jgi:serine/threonine-protein kinase